MEHSFANSLGLRLMTKLYLNLVLQHTTKLRFDVQIFNQKWKVHWVIDTAV